MWPSRSKSAATQPFPRSGRSAPARRLTSSNRPVDVSEQRSPWQPAAFVVLGEVGLRVGVDDEEVEPAVVVVVEPAEAAAHHRRRVVRLPKRNAPCRKSGRPRRRRRRADVPPSVRRAARPATVRRRAAKPPSRARDAIAAALERELHRSRTARRPYHAPWRRRRPSAGPGCLPAGASARIRATSYVGTTILPPRRVDLLPERREPLTRRSVGRASRFRAAQRVGLAAEVGDDVARDPPRRAAVDRRDALRGGDGDWAAPRARRRGRRLRLRPSRDARQRRRGRRSHEPRRVRGRPRRTRAGAETRRLEARPVAPSSTSTAARRRR